MHLSKCLGGTDAQWGRGSDAASIWEDPVCRGYIIAVIAIPNLKTIPTFLGSLTQQCGAAIPQRVALVSGDVEGWQGLEAPLQQRF